MRIMFQDFLWFDESQIVIVIVLVLRCKVQYLTILKTEVIIHEIVITTVISLSIYIFLQIT